MHRLTIQFGTPLDAAAFDRRYNEEHIPLFRDLPGLIGLSLTKPRSLGPRTAPYAVAELDFPDWESIQAALTSPEMNRVAHHGRTLPAARFMFLGEVTN